MSPEFAIIVASDKSEFIVDAEDFEMVNEATWNSSGGYASYRGYFDGVKSYLLHRVLLGAQPNDVVDHINGNTHDNRRSNLRICNKSLNGANSKPRTDGVSKYKGVWKSNRANHKNKPWMMGIRCNYKKYTAGGFTTETEAALAYNKKAKELFGEFARLNEIKEAI